MATAGHLEVIRVTSEEGANRLLEQGWGSSRTLQGGHPVRRPTSLGPMGAQYVSDWWRLLLMKTPENRTHLVRN
jgi:hypothetical protein